MSGSRKSQERAEIRVEQEEGGTSEEESLLKGQGCDGVHVEGVL